VQAGGVPEDLPQEGWFVGVNGVPLGPIPLGDLRELAMAGHIDRRSLVWREGQGEWRPLAKYPGLARVIDDGASPIATPRPEPAAPPVSRSNGSNGHIATGFDAVRADVGERPSAWGDLDDEDDEDEQPTTVKGRVSVMPSAESLPPPPSVAPSAMPAPPPASGNPYGVTSSVLAVPTPQQAPMSFAPSPQLSAPSTTSATPEAVVEGDMGLRRSGRGRWYLLAIVIALAFAFALGAFATQLMRSSSDEPASAKPSRNASSQVETKRSAAVDTEDEEQVEDQPGAEAVADEPTPAAGGGTRRAVTPAADAVRTAGTVAPKTILGATVSAAPATSAPSAAPRPATGSLLAGLGNSPALGPSLGRADERATGSGLDATAIQRTVRRYSPGVRQNCWQRALNSRAPGVPSSAKVTATITVDGAGHVQAVTVSGAPKGYPGLSRCIEGAVKGWQFPRAGGQTVTNVPFMFVGQ
jgi:hypothetical protein